MDYSFESFASASVWYSLVQIFLLCVALLLGNTLRRKVPWVKKSLIPTSLLGGLFILILKFVPAVNNFIDMSFMEIVTYHALALGFIALSLKRNEKKEKMAKVVIETGLVTAATYMLQALVGILVTIVLSLVLVEGFFPGGGVLLCLGFGQGTGQALNYGIRFEKEFGFVGGATFGLTIATVGFFVASIVGVIYLNVLRRRGKLKYAENRKLPSENLADYVHPNDIPNNDSIDKLTINIILVLFVYSLVYLVMYLVKIPLIWGFNFLLGSLFAILIKFMLDFFQKKKVMQKNVTNNYLLDRISGFVFDIMIIAGVAAIDIHALSSMWWQLLIICTVGGIVTFIYLQFACKHLYKGYEYEGFLSMFGMLTGTASNGVILLREIDPAFETPAASTLVLQSLPAIAFGGPVLLLLELCPRGLTQSILTMGIVAVLFAVFSLVIFRTKIFKRKEKANKK